MQFTALDEEIVVEPNKEDVEESRAWLEEMMLDGMDEVLNCPKASVCTCRSRRGSGTTCAG